MPKVLRREPEEELRWDERTVELITCQGREQETALTLGTLAVHGAHMVYERGPSGRGKLTLMDRGGWSVTHLPSGLVVVYGFFAIGAALEAGELLWRSCRAAMQAKRRARFNSFQ